MSDGDVEETDFGIPRVDAAVMTRRHFLMYKALEAGSGPLLAAEAVSSVAIEHPEWDMDEEKTWAEWENHYSE